MEDFVQQWIDINHLMINIMIKTKASQVEPAAPFGKIVKKGAFLMSSLSVVQQIIDFTNKIVEKFHKVSFENNPKDLSDYLYLEESGLQITKCIILSPLEKAVLQSKPVDIGLLDAERDALIVKINGKHKELYGVKRRIQPKFNFKGIDDYLNDSVLLAAFASVIMFVRIYKPWIDSVNNLLTPVLKIRQVGQKVLALPLKVTSNERVKSIVRYSTAMLLVDVATTGETVIKDSFNDIMIFSLSNKNESKGIVSTLKVINDYLENIEQMEKKQKKEIFDLLNNIKKKLNRIHN